jgi:hypothetical protein
MLGIVGGWIALTFNALTELPWPLMVHLNIYLVGIGLGAGTGGYLCWMVLNLRWYWLAASVLIVLLGGIAGTYAGYAYGQSAEVTYLGRAHTINNMAHMGAAIGGAGVATILGVVNEIRTLGR